MQLLYVQGKNWNQFDSQLEDPRASLDVVVKVILCLPGTAVTEFILWSLDWLSLISLKLSQQPVLRLVNTYKNMA